MKKIIAKLLYFIERRKFDKALKKMLKRDVSEWPSIMHKRNYGLEEKEIKKIWSTAEEAANQLSEENFQFNKYLIAFGMIAARKLSKILQGPFSS